jgi:hypothetical protein
MLSCKWWRIGDWQEDGFSLHGWRVGVLTIELSEDCRGDDYLGRPRAEQPTGWRPRDRRDIRPRRPASNEEPAAPAPGLDLLHRRLEPAKTTKPLTITLLKVAGARQEQQRLETWVTPSTHDLATRWWRVVDVGADSPCAWWITSLLGTPRGRYDKYSG